MDRDADLAALAAWLRYEALSGVSWWQSEAAGPLAGQALGASTSSKAPRTASPQSHTLPRPLSTAAAGSASPQTLRQSAGQDAAGGRVLAERAQSLEALEATLADFDGCGLKKTARNLCFADGVPNSPILLIGEAPGAEEDRQGKPFVGPSGQLLDRMLAAAGRPRPTVRITNVVFWRPPGNRAPTAQELAICQPFLERQIALMRPKLLLFVGGTAAKSLLSLKDGVTKTRGKRYVYHGSGAEIPATVMFHPAYLLRQPQHKALAWRDLLAALSWLDELMANADG